MKPEQRFLLTLILTLGVLLAWSLLVAPPPPPELPRPLPAPSTASLPAPKPEPSEPLLHMPLGQFTLGVGLQQGGVKTLRVDGADLLVESSPGILQGELLLPLPVRLTFQTSGQGDLLLSEATVSQPGDLRITRHIFPQGKSRNFMLVCKLGVENLSQTPLPCQLQLVAYRPLHAQAPEERRLLFGSVRVGGKSHPLQLKPGQSRFFQGNPLWIASQGKSHVLIVQLDPPVGMFHVEHSLSGEAIGWLKLPQVTLAPGQRAEWNLHLYAGPMTLSNLREAGLEEAITFGAFSGIAKLLLEILTWSHGWLHNYGWAIVFLSLGIWLIFFPVTWSGVRMMKMMGQLQPQVERIRQEHKKNPQRMNQEILQLYRKYRVNPLSGCLPLLLQMPIFIALYQVLSRSAQLRGANFLWIKDLSAPDAWIRFPSELPLIGKELNLLPILMVIAMFLQQRMTQKSQVALTEEQAMQQRIFRFFPFLFGFLFYGLPSGLVLYWVVNTILTILQQLLVLRSHRG